MVYHEVEDARDILLKVCKKDPSFDALFTQHPIDLDKVLSKLRANNDHGTNFIQEEASGEPAATVDVRGKIKCTDTLDCQQVSF